MDNENTAALGPATAEQIKRSDLASVGQRLADTTGISLEELARENLLSLLGSGPRRGYRTPGGRPAVTLNAQERVPRRLWPSNRRDKHAPAIPPATERRLKAPEDGFNFSRTQRLVRQVIGPRGRVWVRGDTVHVGLQTSDGGVGLGGGPTFRDAFMSGIVRRFIPTPAPEPARAEAA